MKPTNLELHQLKEIDERLMRFKEAEWERLGHPDPRGMFVLIHIFSVPIIGQCLLLIGLLWEWFSKFFRKLVIFFKAFYFYSWVTFDRFETKCFEIWKRMI